MTEPGFEWTELYPRIAEKLFEIKDEPLESRAKYIKRVCDSIGDVPKAIAEKNDPFSFFELFGGGLIRRTLLARLTACTKELFEEEPKLSFVSGIPAIAFRSFQFNKDRSPEIRTCLWDFFFAAMKYANAVDNGSVSDDVRANFTTQYGIIEEKEQFKGTTAVVLFLMRPKIFLPLDSTTRAFLKKKLADNPKGWPESKTEGDKTINLPTYTAVLNGTVPSAEQYLLLCNYVRNELECGNLKNLDEARIVDFPHLSYEAWLAAEITNAIELLESNHQVILTGAPGTGKTFTAKQVAQLLTDDTWDKETGKWKKGRIASVQFHPGYDYSDFVVGMKPILIDSESRQVVKENGNLVIKGTREPPKGKIETSFVWEDGTFKAFADRARTDYDKWCNQSKNDPKKAPKFVFIIDEINRADISRVFGELFSLLEEDYRYPSGNGNDFILLPDGDLFFIPKNLYIIGTMNDIDRSVESMDFALRRRFAWLEVTADESTRIIRAWASKKEKLDSQTVASLEDAKDALNEHIRGKKELSLGEKKTFSLKSKLGPEYELGGAYFTKFDGGKGSKETYEKLWNNHLKIILSEYLRGDKDKADIVDALHRVYLNACGVKDDSNS